MGWNALMASALLPESSRRELRNSSAHLFPDAGWKSCAAGTVPLTLRKSLGRDLHEQ
jgi:hypothetical protein